jgi:hypothetical protein
MKRKHVVKRKFSILNYRLSIVWLFAAIAFASCGGGGNSTKKNDATGEETASGMADKTVSKAPDMAKIPFEHGSYVQESNAMGIKMKTTVYFDNWGERLAGETKDLMGMTTHQLKIEKENKRWELNLVEKTGTVTQSYSSIIVPSSGVDPKSLASMSEKIRKEVTIEELGTEDYLGYKCKKVHVIYPKMEIDAITWTYGNLTMKMEGKMGKMDVNTKIISIDLNPPPASIFEVPEGVNVIEN